ncbi:MAG: cytochrome c [Pseudomonadota bacterium]
MIKNALFIVAAASLAASLPVHAKGGNAEAGKAKSTSCAACHGEVGVSAISSFPTLAGQKSDYLYHALKDYKTGKRANPLMAEQVKSLSDQDMRDLAAFYSRQKGLTLKY